MTDLSAAPRIVAEDGERRAELWPSLGEYPVYDAFVYHLMTHDEVRNARYRAALAETAPGRVVVDVGTGQDLLWARVAAEAGARHVYAIESLADAAERAGALGRELGRGLGCPIDVYAGFAQDVTLPEPTDVCVVEMVGSIGSAEGIAAVAHDARQRLLADAGLVIPGRIVTQACGVTLPDELADDPGFTVAAADYVEQVWAAAGGPFDVRLAVRGVEPGHVLTAARPIEDLDLAGGAPTSAADAEVMLTVERPGRLDGLLLWTQVWTRPGVPPLETFPTTGSGLPVYVPLFRPGLGVTPGSALTVAFRRRTGADGFHPDYRFEAALDGGPAATVELPYAGGGLGQNAFYAALWAD